jgi:hypothetical protein
VIFECCLAQRSLGCRQLRVRLVHLRLLLFFAGLGGAALGLPT